MVVTGVASTLRKLLRLPVVLQQPGVVVHATWLAAQKTSRSSQASFSFFFFFLVHLHISRVTVKQSVFIRYPRHHTQAHLKSQSASIWTSGLHHSHLHMKTAQPKHVDFRIESFTLNASNFTIPTKCVGCHTKQWVLHIWQDTLTADGILMRQKFYTSTHTHVPIYHKTPPWSWWSPDNTHQHSAACPAEGTTTKYVSGWFRLTLLQTTQWISL